MRRTGNALATRLLCGGGALLAVACGQTDTQGDAYALPSLDAAGDLHAATDTAEAVDATADTEVTALDSAGNDIVAGFEVADAANDASAPDSPPTWLPLAPLTLAEGASTTLDLNPLMADAKDADPQLKVLWSAQHVALQDPGSHFLYVVAPTGWTGTEAIDLTVRDTAGLTATATLQVTVTEVVVAPPQTVDTCGKLTFLVAAGKGQHVVLLSGSFNNWGTDDKTADVMTDPKGTGDWTVEKTLAPGVYQYKFIVDGKWQADSNNPNQVPDSYNGKNSVVEVPQCKP